MPILSPLKPFAALSAIRNFTGAICFACFEANAARRAISSTRADVRQRRRTRVPFPEITPYHSRNIPDSGFDDVSLSLIWHDDVSSEQSRAKWYRGSTTCPGPLLGRYQAAGSRLVRAVPVRVTLNEAFSGYFSAYRR